MPKSNLSPIAALSALACGIHPHSAQADDICAARALRDVPAMEDPSSILHRGQTDEAITAFRVNGKTGETSYCSHGGYCYPTHVHVGDDLLLALKMTNCKPSAAAGATDSGEPDLITYGVDVIRSRIPSGQMRREDVKNRLLTMGLCSACADNVAQYYTAASKSRCAELARAALEGNPDAVAGLQGDPAYCTWNTSAHP